MDYECDCSSCNSNYTGKNCSQFNYCKSRPCLNGGKCLNSWTNSSYQCMCPEGFSGANCETQIDYCSPNPCQNGGVCTKWGFFSYKCSCQSNYTGFNCQLPNYCNINNQPCQNGGTCVNTRSSYACICTQWFSGSTCQNQLNYCKQFSPCSNGATCVSCYNNANCQLGSYYQCNCANGYAGTNCNGFTSSSTCANSCRGRRCIISNGVYYCAGF